MSDLLFWIGLIIGLAAFIIVSAVAILRLTEKLERKPSTQDPQTTTNKKLNFQYKTKLEKYEEVLRKIANDLVTSGATAGSTQLIQAIDDYIKAAKKATNRSIVWTMLATTVVLSGYMAAKQDGRLPDFLKPDPTVRQHVQPKATPIQPQGSKASNIFAKDLATLRGLKSWTEVPKSVSEQKAGDDAFRVMATTDSPEQYYPEFAAALERDWPKIQGGQPFNDAQRRYLLSTVAPDILKHIHDAYKHFGDSERMTAELQSYYQQVTPVWQQTLNDLGETAGTAARAK